MLTENPEHPQRRKAGFKLFLSLCGMVMTLALLAASCSQRERHSEESSEAEAYHADYDIAMLMRSIVDAVNVGEQLDSAQYNFEGILTDGQGTPLYTDQQGRPGAWEVEVSGDNKVMVRNVAVGNLLPDDLRDYVLASIGLTEADRLSTTEFDDDDDTAVDIYAIEGGNIRFESRTAISSGGREGLLLQIMVVKS